MPPARAEPRPGFDPAAPSAPARVVAAEGWAALAARPSPRVQLPARAAPAPGAEPQPQPAAPSAPSVVIDQIQVITPPAPAAAADPLASLQTHRARHVRSRR